MSFEDKRPVDFRVLEITCKYLRDGGETTVAKETLVERII